jgi:non-ribosomal peptide synthetase component F
MSRSIELIVALGAVVRAAATYVPIDPTYPPERRKYMIEDSGVCSHFKKFRFFPLSFFFSPSPRVFERYSTSVDLDPHRQ